MQAVVMEQFGDAEVLQLRELPDPVAGPGEVVVRLEASALNWHDVLVRQGQYSSPLPHVLGADGTGTRLDTGEAVVILPSLHWGAREAAPAPEWEILGDHRQGTYAELVAVPEECLFPRPPGLGVDESAALALVGVTTFRALVTRGRLVAGERVLVLGASGGVATTAVSIGSALGARVVVTSSSSDKIAAAVGLGAVGGVDHSAPDWVSAARDLAPGGFDLVLDPVGRWAESVACLAPGGRLVVLGASAGATATLDIRPYYFGQFELLGTTMGSPADFAGLLHLLDAYDVPTPVVDRAFALGDATAAHRHLEGGTGFGKVVLRT